MNYSNLLYYKLYIILFRVNLFYLILFLSVMIFWWIVNQLKVFISMVSTHWLQHIRIHMHKHCSFWHLSCHSLPVSISGLNVTLITANYRTHHWQQKDNAEIPKSIGCLLNVTLFCPSMHWWPPPKRQHCWSMKATWWHILEPFEPIRVMYVSAAGIVSDAFGWRCSPSFFRVIRKTSQAVTGGCGATV